MKNELVFTKRNEIYASSKDIAEKLDVPHTKLLRSVTDLLMKGEKHRTGTAIVFFKESGAKFKESSFKTKMGREYKSWDMNKRGFMLLVMQLGNYKKAFKVQNDFVNAFASMEQALLNHQNASWQEARRIGKVARIEETDVIKIFIDYATKQGSKSASKYYMAITKMTNKALELLIKSEFGKPIREFASGQNLSYIMLADMRARDAIEVGMSRKLPYKEIYRYAKDEVLKLVDVIDFKPKKELKC